MTKLVPEAFQPDDTDVLPWYNHYLQENCAILWQAPSNSKFHGVVNAKLLCQKSRYLVARPKTEITFPIGFQISCLFSSGSEAR